MNILSLLKALDKIDTNFNTPFVSKNQLRMFFPKESQKNFSASIRRHTSTGVITKIHGDLYMNPRSRFIPCNLIEHIARLIMGKEKFYLSLESVLSDHGVISQIPNRLTFITDGKSRVCHTPHGILEFTHGGKGCPIDDNGIYMDKNTDLLTATPERAERDARVMNRSVDLIDEQREKDNGFY